MMSADLDNAPLEAETSSNDILEEAQALMNATLSEEEEELLPPPATSNSDSMVIGGFAIDSDDEGDDKESSLPEGSLNEVDLISEEKDPLTAALDEDAVTKSLNGNRLTIHPLQDEVVRGSSGAHIQAPSLADVKAKASGFANSVAIFAMKTANNVANAAAGTQTVQPAAIQQTNSINTLPYTTQLLSTPRAIVELDNEQKMRLLDKHLGQLLPGERVLMFLTNLLHVSDSSGYDYPTPPGSMWCCCMTYYRVVLFCTASCVVESPPWFTLPTPPSLLQMPLGSMAGVEKSVYTTAQNVTLMCLVIHGKDNGRQLRFTTPSYSDTLRVHESIQTYAFPGRRNLGYLFAFESKRGEVMGSIVVDQTGKKQIMLPPTKKRFDAIAEYYRQFGNMSPSPWACYTQLNAQYQLCMSYPCILVGPTSLPEGNPDSARVIRQCAAFRSEQRLPSMTWSNGMDGASLWRASQPKVGLQGNRNVNDELYLKHIMDAAASANALRSEQPPVLSAYVLKQLTGAADPKTFSLDGSIGLLKILDLRPRASAIANRTSGYGYENTTYYPGSTIQFCNIGNIHAVRDSYQKLSNVCMSPTTNDVQWMSLVEDTKWLSHLRLILSASWEAAFWIHVYRVPVFVHCSHGWDRTSQVVALAQLFLDPYYRTREGFSTLIEKDFMSFGHPFHTRCSHGEGRGENPSNDDGQISPIFIQFLDAVYQIVNQYPEAFEFNTKYLLVLSENVYSCRFGTLLCDTERERELVAGIRQRTHSIWDYLEMRTDTKNTSFQKQNVLLMPLPSLLRNVKLWVDRHCMYGPKLTLRLVDFERTMDPSAADQQGEEDVYTINVDDDAQSAEVSPA